MKIRSSVVLITAILLFASGISNAKVIEIRAATFESPGEATKAFDRFIKKVHEKAGDKIKIKSIGGPEAVPPRDQPEAARRGSVDFVFVPSSYYTTMVPEATSLAYSRLTPLEEKKVGYFDFLSQLHEQAGLHYIGRTIWGTLFNIWLNAKIERPQELDKKMLRVGKSPTDFMKALGAIPVSLPIGDIFSAMERGMVNGFVLPADYVVQMRLYEVAKYGLKPGFWNRDEVFIMNLKTWKGLPKEVQDAISKTQTELEADLVKESENLLEESFKVCQQKGVQTIEFAPADAKGFLNKADEVAWESMKNKIKPENFSKLQKMLAK
jgi:TRAP-type transport system periplasmic protein